MTQVRSWLPAEAIQRGVRDVALRTCVREWAAAWFTSRQVDLAGDPVSAQLSGRTRGTSWQLADGVAVSLAEDADTRIAAQMFGTPEDPGSLTVADRAALDAAAEACITDLRTRLVSSLRLVGGGAWRARTAEPDTGMSWWTWRVTDGRGDALLEIALSEDLIVKRERAALPPVPVGSRLSLLAVALSDQPVTVSALVGRSRLTTTELAGLTPGDVLVLDRDVGAEVDIAVEHRPKSLRCTVDRQDDRLQLTIV
jgi:flagellar motor switch/type III secretory pathway protein FliN